MGGMLGSLAALFGGGPITTVLLLGMLALLVFRSDRVTNGSNFRLSVLLLVVSVALPGVMILLMGSMEGGDGIFGRIFMALPPFATAGSVYFLFESVSVGSR